MYRAQRRVEAAVNRAKKAGVTPDELRLIPVVQLLCNSKDRPVCRTPQVLLILILTIASVALYLQMYAVKNCLVPLPPDAYKLFREPENCAMCRDVGGVQRVSELAPHEFEQRFAYSGRPVVVTDGTRGWTAPAAFTFDFFREVYMNGAAPDQRDCQFFPYKTEFRTLTEALNMSRERSRLEAGTSPWYIGWSSCDPAATDLLREHYSRPYFLPDTSQSTDLDWIFMGGPGNGAHLHVDNVKFPSWQAQLRGQKQWRLVPPPECYFTCEEFSVTVQPGEIIVVDTNRWYHQTFIVSDDISITIGSEFD